MGVWGVWVCVGGCVGVGVSRCGCGRVCVRVCVGVGVGVWVRGRVGVSVCGCVFVCVFFLNFEF